MWTPVSRNILHYYYIYDSIRNRTTGVIWIHNMTYLCCIESVLLYWDRFCWPHRVWALNQRQYMLTSLSCLVTKIYQVLELTPTYWSSVSPVLKIKRVWLETSESGWQRCWACWGNCPKGCLIAPNQYWIYNVLYFAMGTRMLPTVRICKNQC